METSTPVDAWPQAPEQGQIAALPLPATRLRGRSIHPRGCPAAGPESLSENHQDTKNTKGTMRLLFVSFVFLCVLGGKLFRPALRCDLVASLDAYGADRRSAPHGSLPLTPVGGLGAGNQPSRKRLPSPVGRGKLFRERWGTSPHPPTPFPSRIRNSEFGIRRRGRGPGGRGEVESNNVEGIGAQYRRTISGR